jgi:hypothetical protein
MQQQYDDDQDFQSEQDEEVRHEQVRDARGQQYSQLSSRQQQHQLHMQQQQQRHVQNQGQELQLQYTDGAEDAQQQHEYDINGNSHIYLQQQWPRVENRAGGARQESGFW